MKIIQTIVGTIGTYATMIMTNFEAGQLIPGLPGARSIDVPPGTGIEELVKLILSVAGGLLSTIILAWLKRKWPDLFERITKGRLK